jgi:cellulose synthase/poly-beta-1,6-N-acetylglucosamine synthase-like glycosyltransferase
MTEVLWGVSGIVGALFLICQLRFALLMLAARRVAPVSAQSDTPLVAIQVATYREAETIASLLDAIDRLDWPRDRLLVQILDDSPSADAARIDAIVAEHAGRGLPVRCHRRGSREGFKAGALNHGLDIASPAAYIAYFDADCRPDRQFLRRTMPHLANPQVAAVQARWRFPNALASPLTALQAAAFEYLFAYDLPVRANLGLPAYYFGSAAVWRRAVPVALGGWRFKPFTAEDVDMGLRAGNAGWQLAYEAEDLADDDAVEDILAFRTQQRRWAQAVLQAGVSAMRSLPCSTRRPWATLMDWSSFAPHALIPLTVLMTLCLALWVLLQVPPAPAQFWGLSVLMVASPAILALVAAERQLHRSDWLARVLLLLRAGPYLAAAMSSFLLGFVDFLRPDKLEFVATPKAGRAGVIDGRTAKWINAHISPLILDSLFAVLFGAAAVVAWRNAVPSALLPLLLMSAQFLSSALLTGGALLKRVRMEASAKLAAG